MYDMPVFQNPENSFEYSVNYLDSLCKRIELKKLTQKKGNWLLFWLGQVRIVKQVLGPLWAR